MFGKSQFSPSRGTPLDLIIRGKVEVLLFETAVKTDQHSKRDSAKCQYLGHRVLLKTCKVDDLSGWGLDCPREECYLQTAVDSEASLATRAVSTANQSPLLGLLHFFSLSLANCAMLSLWARPSLIWRPHAKARRSHE